MAPHRYLMVERSVKVWILAAYMIGALSLLPRCKREETIIVDDPSPELSQVILRNLAINNWIWDVMSEVYYWKESMPKDPAEVNLQRGYASFMATLFSPEDEFSDYADHFDITETESSDIDSTMGFSFVIGEFYDMPGTYFVVVEFTYEGSGAGVAGLKRGDIILKINIEDITQNNLEVLFTGRSYEVTLGRYNATYHYISETSDKRTLTAIHFRPWPVLHAGRLHTTGDKVVGYLAYGAFDSGDNGDFNHSIDYYLDQMASQGVNVLILDLRYNRGGDLAAAQYLASCLAPQWARDNHEILVNLEWNPYLNNLFKAVQGENSDYLNIKFLNNTGHLELESLYILTTGRTASASELLIAGLKPYLNAVTVGQKTYGKYYGLYIFLYEGEFKNATWAIAPVVNRYRNIQGEPGTPGGIPADIGAEESLLLGHPLGSTYDPTIALVLDIINGSTKSGTGPESIHPEFNWIDELSHQPGSNLFLNGALELDLPLDHIK
jgi:carboxyl-terminal processing protease